MTNVRIGNDIRINLTLKGSKRNFEQRNIKQIRAYLINTSFKDFTHFNPCFECRRFPNDPNPFNHHDVTPDCIGVCGEPCYHAHPHCHPHHPHFGLPHDHCGYVCCDHADGAVPCNPAFGEGPLRPNYGHPWHCHDWGHHWHPCCHCPEDTCCHEPFPLHSCNFRYMADCRFIDKSNKIQVYFPAHDQYAPGVYKVVIAVVTFDAGWGCQNLHHYTMDYGELFTLSDEGIDGDIIIDGDNGTIDGDGGDIVDILIESENYYMYPGKMLHLGDEDNKGTKYNIKVVLSNGAVLNYDPDTFSDVYGDKLNFKVINVVEPAMTVLSDGTICAENTIVNRVRNTIMVYANLNKDVSAFYNVWVEGDANVDYFGFAPVRPRSIEAMDAFNRKDQAFEDYNNTSLDQQELTITRENDLHGIETLESNGYKNKFFKTKDIFSTFNITYNSVNGNSTNIPTCPCDCEECTCNKEEEFLAGQYLWIISRSRITRAMIDSVTIPMTFVGQNETSKMYYYCSLNPMESLKDIEGGINLTIK